MKRLGYALADLTPRQIRARATARREGGHAGGLNIQIAAVVTMLYNRKKGTGQKLPAAIAPSSSPRRAA